jgi:predicted O-methyltransferase YrrM
MLDKIKTIIWFIKKPQYFPQVIQVLKRKRYIKKENTSQEALQWCKNNCISKEDALLKLNINKKLVHPKDVNMEIYNWAKKQEETCPVKMGGEGATDILYTLTYYLKPKKVIETGVAYGWSSLAILLAIQDVEDAKLISNDMPYIKMNNDDFVGCVVHDKLRNKWELQRLPDVKGIPLALKKFNGNIDMCHYDSDKSYTGRMFAYPILWKALKKGGIFISDDIQDNIAFKDFAENIQIHPIIIEHQGKYVGILQKT